jgi:Putative DNA-binding domain
MIGSNSSPSSSPSPRLDDAFGAVHAVLRGAQVPQTATAQVGLDPGRMAFYADAVYSHVQEVLEEDFSSVAAVLGSSRFERLVREYFESRPFDAYELNENAAAFRELLARCAAQGRHGVTGFHVDLAELEWQEFTVYVSPERIPDQTEVRVPTLNPTLVILQLDHAVNDFLDQWRDGGDEASVPTLPDPPDQAEPTTLFVLRHPETENALFVAADEALLFALKVAHDGLTESEAAQAAAVPIQTVQSILQSAADWGVVVLPEEKS